ncbi:MAG: aminotransferase class V-fold PLP-dependent enzyme [Thermoanaerobaculia bacterium]|nr:aminotransferase class V-fold PLP-dependent enzyme [Thermoanaerobaculia bacterium]
MSELELASDEFERLAAAAVAALAEHWRTLPGTPAIGHPGGETVARGLAGEPCPETGRDFADILSTLFEVAVPPSFGTTHPGFLAYVPGGGLPAAALGQFLAAGINRYVGLYAAAPALAQLEANVLRWFAEMLGLPAATRGLFTSGGSLAGATALVTARRERLSENFLNGVIYVSDQTHHAIAKAAVLAGFPDRNIRSIPSDRHFRLDLAALETAIRQDRAAGATPFLVVGNAGTTNTGAVDPLPAIAEIAAREGLWFHIDAAYGGFYRLTERGRAVLAGIERADSVVLDPHKGLFLPYGTGALLVRDGAALARAHHVAADYLPPPPDVPEAADFQALSPELTRPFRGLGVWLPFHLHGVAAFRAALDEKLDLARWITTELPTIPHLQLVAAPELTILAFRLEPPGLDGEALDCLNQAWLDRTHARGRVFLSGTRLHGRFTPRIAIQSFRTHREQVAACLADLRAAAEELTQGV